VAEGQV